MVQMPRFFNVFLIITLDNNLLISQGKMKLTN